MTKTTRKLCRANIYVLSSTIGTILGLVMTWLLTTRTP